MGRRPGAWELRKLILMGRNLAEKQHRGQGIRVPLPFYPRKHSSQSSPKVGMAASRMSEFPVPGGMCMKAEQPQVRGTAEGMPTLEGVWAPSLETMVVRYMLALKSHQWNPV